MTHIRRRVLERRYQRRPAGIPTFQHTGDIQQQLASMGVTVDWLRQVAEELAGGRGDPAFSAVRVMDLEELDTRLEVMEQHIKALENRVFNGPVAKMNTLPPDTPGYVEQTFRDTVFSKITVFNQAPLERGNVGVDVANARITIQETGEYKFTFSASMGFAAAEELEFTIYHNGNPILPGFHEQGRNVARPFVENVTSVFHFDKGDTLESWARNADTGSVTVRFYACAMMVVRI